MNFLQQFLIQVIIVIFTTRILSLVLHKLNQPRVIAEVLGGIILGPSVLGDYSLTLFPKESLKGIEIVANIGLILYLFLIGIEMDINATFKNLKKTIFIALLGIVIPFIFGFTVSEYFYKLYPSSVALSTFSVFICVAMGITAFPVLCRILNETNMLKTTVGVTALSAASIDDIFAWCSLAYSVAMIKSNSPLSALLTFFYVIVYATGIIVVFRPWWCKLINFVYLSKSHALQMVFISLTYLMVFVSALVTEIIGVHAIFGAFLFGLAMPRSHPFTIEITGHIEELVQIVFLPLYFTLSGLHTNLRSNINVIVLLVIIATATASKFIGCFIGSKLIGMSWRESTAIGILMNTRGLVELIVLNVGLEAKVITQEIFSMMVIMALVSTVITTPILTLVYPEQYRTYLTVTSETINSLIIVNSISEIPCIVNIISLLKLKNINAITFIESSTKTTDIVKALEPCICNEEQLTLLETIGVLIGSNIKTKEIIGNPNTFSNELLRIIENKRIDYALIPYYSTSCFIANSYKNIIQDASNYIHNVIYLKISKRGFHFNKKLNVFVIITDYSLFEIINNMSNVNLTVLILNEKLTINFKWDEQVFMVNNDSSSLLRIINDNSFDIIIASNTNYLLDGVYEPIDCLGTIGTFLSDLSVTSLIVNKNALVDIRLE